MKASKYASNLFLGALGSTFRNSNFLRRNETETEKLLWKYLRRKNLGGYKFRRQHAIARFVADFYCAEKKLIIELDGAVHNYEENKNYDRLRTEILGDSKVNILRFRNSEVEKDIKKVLEKILESLEAL